MELGQSGTDGVAGNPGGHQSHGGWVFPALLAAVLLVAAAIAFGTRQGGPRPTAPRTIGDWTLSAEPQGNTASLEIDFGNGARKHIAALPWRAGMTAADLMGEARDFRPGIEYTQVGTGDSGLLTSIDGLKDEGGGGRNWRYRVDDRYGEESFCLEPIEPGMRLLWEFAAGDYNGGRK